ncbi:MAG TPA: hypothetical protein VJ914_29850 [Pseudonocardiaceae bacterium]|nr:hypothetical protein [Pseudonocardiaceae bacterium]
MIAHAMGPHTMDDWRTTPEERLELIDGHFRELPLFTMLHQCLNSELWRLLDDLRLGNGWGSFRRLVSRSVSSGGSP